MKETNNTTPTSKIKMKVGNLNRTKNEVNDSNNLKKKEKSLNSSWKKKKNNST
jgi:hypothetical protein